MKKYSFFAAFILFGASLCPAQDLLPESAGVERYAIFIGSNEGGETNQRLMYAGTDAIAFRKTMSEIGGIPQSNSILLLEPSKEDLDDAMQTVSDMIEYNKKRSKRSEFLFYYSGHSDENALLVGKAKYDYSSLKAAISKVPSDVHVVILDSCYSGNFIRTKGGQKRKPFLFDDSSVVKGHAYLSSSSSQESSQESDEIGSSFFTNAMLTGLRGAADSSGDKKVTLNELYSYAFNETLSKTENTSVGPQHPNYNITLVGSGDLVLSDISASDCVVALAPELRGRIIIRSKNGNLVSEINKTTDKQIFLALDRGDYNATLITETKTYQGSFSLKQGKVYELKKDDLSQIHGIFNRVRGESQELSSVNENDDDEEEDDDDDFVFPERVISGDTMYVPFELSLVNNELSAPYGKKVIASFSLGLVRSKIYRADGIMVGLIGNVADIVNGAQISDIYNIAGDVHGIQAACIFNEAKGNVSGAQDASIFNRAKKVHGVQAAGIFNTATDVRGVQAAGIYNYSRNFDGFQIAGICNTADDVSGVQVAGIYNAAKSVNGLQVSGICNYASKLPSSGVQIGVINVASESDGIQLGLFNFAGNGILEIGASYTTNKNIRVVLNSGNNHLYSILGYTATDTKFSSDDFREDDFSAFFYGLGSRLCIGPLNFDIEIIGNVVPKVEKIEGESKEETKYTFNDPEGFPSVRCSLGFTPVKHLRLFAGAMLSFETERNSAAFENLTKNIVIKDEDFTVYPEFDFGIRYTMN